MTSKERIAELERKVAELEQKLTQTKPVEYHYHFHSAPQPTTVWPYQWTITCDTTAKTVDSFIDRDVNPWKYLGGE